MCVVARAIPAKGGPNRRDTAIFHVCSVMMVEKTINSEAATNICIVAFDNLSGQHEQY
jgi:hypothetical protein